MATRTRSQKAAILCLQCLSWQPWRSHNKVSAHKKDKKTNPLTNPFDFCLGFTTSSKRFTSWPCFITALQGRSLCTKSLPTSINFLWKPSQPSQPSSGFQGPQCEGGGSLPDVQAKGCLYCRCFMMPHVYAVRWYPVIITWGQDRPSSNPDAPHSGMI